MTPLRELKASRDTDLSGGALKVAGAGIGKPRKLSVLLE